MTVIEAKERIENELKAAAESFGPAASLVKYDVDVEVNHIEGAPVDVTSVLGSLSIGPEGAEGNERLYLPLDVELDDDDIIDEAAFEENLVKFKEIVSSMKDRVLASDDYNSEISAIIEEFDNEMDEKYRQEIERLNKTAKRNLIIAAVATAIAGLAAVAILVFNKVAGA